MSSILYYSNFCKPSKQLLSQIRGGGVDKKIHFICIDQRSKGENGETNILLPNGQSVILPPTITKVPALLLLYRGNRIIYGKKIIDFLKPEIKNNNNIATNGNGEPLAFSTYEMGSSLSDNYSYLDTTAEDLSAKGAGGLRILHNYVTLDAVGGIETPPEDYEPDKIGQVDLGKIQQQRNQEIHIPRE